MSVEARLGASSISTTPIGKSKTGWKKWFDTTSHTTDEPAAELSATVAAVELDIDETVHYDDVTVCDGKVGEEMQHEPRRRHRDKQDERAQSRDRRRGERSRVNRSSMERKSNHRFVSDEGDSSRAPRSAVACLRVERLFGKNLKTRPETKDTSTS